MQLTQHFSQAELGVAATEQRLIDNATFLCQEVLEHVRAMFGPVRVHDGYRDPGHNARVGGKTASFHLSTDGHAAADIDAQGCSITRLFDWLRLESGLHFNKVILETNAQNVPACVHIQIDRFNRPRRQAFIGHTGSNQVSPSCLTQNKLAHPPGRNASIFRADFVAKSARGTPKPLTFLQLRE